MAASILRENKEKTQIFLSTPAKLATGTLYIKKSNKATANYVGHERPRAEAHTRAVTSVASIATMTPQGAWKRSR